MSTTSGNTWAKLKSLHTQLNMLDVLNTDYSLIECQEHWILE
jgi:hypothetical protein